MATTERVGGPFPTLLAGSYDCVDRVVLRAYFRFAQHPAGFRLWWRRWQGSDAGLDNAHLMREAGRFSRRVKAWASKRKVPLVFASAGERKEDISEAHRPADPEFEGVFLIVVGRAPGQVWDVVPTVDGRIRRIQRKQSWVNHYAVHIWDRLWGHVIIRFCPHPPFNALVILNGHEWVAVQASRNGIPFQKQDNCFTEIANAAGLHEIAETLSSDSSEGRLVQVCERWIYSAVLCFVLDTREQERTGFQYSYSVYQAEYSRNLLFRSGREMDQVFQRLIDRVRGPLQVQSICTLFGRRQRPRRQKGQPHVPVVEVVLERPVYDLIIFRVRFGRCTLKIYTKGERVLRIEAMAHNARDLRCGTAILRFPAIVAALRSMVERFIEVIDCIDCTFVDSGVLDDLPKPARLGQARVGGIDLNLPRMRAVVESVLSLAPQPNGFTSSELRDRVHARLSPTPYTLVQAAYDLRKLRGKGFVLKLAHSRRYRAPAVAIRSLGALLLIREQVLRPLLAAASRPMPLPAPRRPSQVDRHYAAIRHEMNRLFDLIGIAA